jgi:hypothetical protein
MQENENGQFISQQGNYSYLYHANTGLTRIDNPKENA